MKFKFCPYCRSRLEEKEKLFRCSENDHTIFKNSVPAVAAIPIKDNQILLGRRLIDPHKGKWDVIGGFSDPGEHPEKTVLRETKEETDLDANILDFTGIYMDKYLFKKTNYDVMVCQGLLFLDKIYG